MGHYTRLKFDAVLGADTPQPVIDFLVGATSYRWPAPENLPRHPLFTKGHWMDVLRGRAAAPCWPEADGVLTIEPRDDGSNRISFHTSLRNYENEVDAFCDWIAPYVVDAPGAVVGEFESEMWDHDRRPSLLIAQHGAIGQLEQRRPPDRDAFGGY